MVPMHVSPEVCEELQSILGCRLEGFPQVYLGLPLSNVKLNLSAFSPYIAKVDKHLSGWQNQLLNPRGRSVLVNSVMDGSAGYLMAALLLPQGTLDALDQRRRAFIWSGADKTTGAQCLIAWPNVCLPKVVKLDGPLSYFSKFVWRSQILRLANGARASEMPPQPKDQKHC
ncbi:retrotransposon protein, putative, unclassified [Panicum miliaceum]|uniref:Retrotransposon protein, putative, unclassified n=1 Tax=Panicum miliaceum TaxID=4540 RepID=A0A3L6QIY3_PANMI|nr:retrotransposon protein, putative, unclassified [Panicum miliaceum]